jgi:hypothetical protein
MVEDVIDITDEIATYPVEELIKLLSFLQKNGYTKTCFDGYNVCISLIRIRKKKDEK